MQNSRTKNSFRNILWGVISKIIALVLPFVVRTILIKVLSEAYVGVNSLFSSILQVLNLTELGFSSAVTFALYKPVAEQDNSKIRAYLYYFRKIYRTITLIILVVGLIIMPFLPLLIKKDCPADLNLYVIYAIYLANTCLGYFVYGYKSTLVIANQRADINSKVHMLSLIIKYSVEIAVLLIFKNYYVYAIIMLISTLFQNILMNYITKKMYPDCYPEGKLSVEEKAKLKRNVIDLFGHKLSGLFLNSFDSIVISVFLGATILGAYNNYYYIMNSVNGILVLLSSSLTASIGNKMVNESVENNYKLFKKIDFIYKWLVSFCTCCLICLYQPFMKVWGQLAGVKLTTFSIYFVILLCMYFYFLTIRNPICVYKEAAGLWHSDRIRPYVESAINLVCNIVLIQLMGLNGVVLSSILALVLTYPWQIESLFKGYFKTSSKDYYLKLLYNIVITALASVLCYYLVSLLPNTILFFILKCVIACIVPNIILLVANIKSNELKTICKQLIDFVKKLFGKNKEQPAITNANSQFENSSVSDFKETNETRDSNNINDDLNNKQNIEKLNEINSLNILNNSTENEL